MLDKTKRQKAGFEGQLEKMKLKKERRVEIEENKQTKPQEPQWGKRD